MKANELRINNLAHAIELYGQPNGDIVVVNPKWIENSDKLKPIPLTEEWLLKFGFKKWKSGYNFSKKRVIVYKHRFCGLCYGKTDNRVELKYVHQLQNLYHALSGGEELTIKKQSNNNEH